MKKILRYRAIQPNRHYLSYINYTDSIDAYLFKLVSDFCFTSMGVLVCGISFVFSGWGFEGSLLHVPQWSTFAQYTFIVLDTSSVRPHRPNSFLSIVLKKRFRNIVSYVTYSKQGFAYHFSTLPASEFHAPYNNLLSPSFW